LTDESKALVRYRLERAKETLDEAKVLFEAGYINTYVNRLYYACFYAVSALLISRQESTSKHGYLRSLFHREFIKTGLLPIESGKHFDLLFQSRQKGDYSDYITFEADEVGDWLDKTKEFVSQIEKYLSHNDIL
jgi:uncharacterized protein (UPF0332 family)